MITREEGNTNDDGNKSNPNNKASLSSNSTTSWTRLKDPRIVRVSRAFGGKDRHSKVCTVRGLRDRSQGFHWVDEIDELALPLQIPPGSLNPNLYPMLGIGGLPHIFHHDNIAGASSSEFDPKEINFQMLNNSGSENPLSKQIDIISPVRRQGSAEEAIQLSRSEQVINGMCLGE
ncbi:hypothetical protein HAX54_039663 [Datura stramonium]|uniref:Uncharacterized protein n=1 Tax=Datura stramonium TaxID=4076 RepID=A0ABS8SJ58_DATST|nr:hypothetical protein [Datura stramonium]